MNSVDRALRAHYRSKSLPSDRMNALLSATRGVAPAPRRMRRRSLFTLAVAACAAGSAAVLLGRTLRDPPAANLLAATDAAAEVAKNHRKNAPVSVASGDLRTIQGGLANLDFTMVPADLPASASFAVQGARHCSIDGQVAAQVKLHGPSASRATLYQTRYRNSFGELDGADVAVGDVRVRFWRQGDVLLALATDN